MTSSRGEKMPTDGVEFYCHFCSCLVVICRACWRGQRYCGSECSLQAARDSHRRSQSRYARSALGRASQLRRSRSHRLKKNATDGGTNPPPVIVKPPRSLAQDCCWFCGKKVEKRFVFLTRSASFSLRRVADGFSRDSS